MKIKIFRMARMFLFRQQIKVKIFKIVKFQASDDSFCPELVRAVEGVRYIAEVTRR